MGKDPEIRSTPSGTLVANFPDWPPATAIRILRATGRTAPSGTTWSRSSAPAEIIRDYVKKGSKLYIEGKPQNPAIGKTKATKAKPLQDRDHRQRSLSALGPRRRRLGLIKPRLKFIQLGRKLRPTPGRLRLRLQPTSRNLRRRHPVLALHPQCSHHKRHVYECTDPQKRTSVLGSESRNPLLPFFSRVEELSS